MPRVKWSEVKEPAQVPPGWYTVVVSKARDKQSSKGDEMTAITFEIIDEGDYKGEKVFHNIVYNEGALPNAKVCLEAMGVALSDDADFEASDLEGRTLKIQTRMGEYMGQKRPECTFRGFKSTDAEAPEVNVDETPQAVDDIKF